MTGAAPQARAALISVVLPIHRQADHLAEMVRSYESALSQIGVPFELILVINGRQDPSLALAHELASTSRVVRVIAAETARWGLGVKLGLAAARGDLLCYTNSARTSGEDLALVLLYAMAYPGVVIKVNRRVREKLSRRLGSLLYNLECRLLFDLSCWDLNGTPKAFPRACHKLLALERDDDLIDLEFNVVCRREGYRMLEVPVLSTRRHGGRSTTNWRTAWRLYWGALRLWQRERKRATTREQTS